jgi:hypothetical protein
MLKLMHISVNSFVDDILLPTFAAVILFIVHQMEIYHIYT